jgi:predicted RNA-binding protein with TRAM domain
VEEVMTQKLLPCPFCGAQAHPVWHTLENTWGVHCTECTGQLYYIGLSTEEAIAAWNTRTASPGNWQETVNELAAAQAEIEKLTQERDGARKAMDYLLSDPEMPAGVLDRVRIKMQRYGHEVARQALGGAA